MAELHSSKSDYKRKNLGIVSAEGSDEDDDYSRSSFNTLSEQESGEFIDNLKSHKITTASRLMSLLNEPLAKKESSKFSTQRRSGSVPSIFEEDESRTRRTLNHISSTVLSAFSHVVHAVTGVFAPRDTGKEREKRQFSRRKLSSDQDAAEIRAHDDTIYWRSGNHTVVVKRNPEQYTVFEIKQNDPPGRKKKPKKEEEKPSIPKAKEMTPLGVTVFRQPARGICIGSQQGPGAVKIVLNYTQKLAFVQLISPNSEVYATYHVNSITFLTTCSPLGVAWIGDMYTPDEGEPVTTEEPRKRLRRQKIVETVVQSETDVHDDAESVLSRPDSLFLEPSAVRAWMSPTPDDQSLNHTEAPSVQESRILSQGTPITQAEIEDLRKLLNNEDVGETDPEESDTVVAEKKLSGHSAESELSEPPEETSIDIVHVVFSNPQQGQRLKTVVETLKSALRCHVPPFSGAATLHGSNHSCLSSSNVSSSTGDRLSHISSDQESEIPLRCSGWCIVPCDCTDYQESQTSPQDVIGDAGQDQRVYYPTEQSPLQSYYRNNYPDQKDNPENVPAKISMDKSTDRSSVQQNSHEPVASDLSHQPVPNSEVKQEPGLLNEAQHTVQSQSLQQHPNELPGGSLQDNNYSLQCKNAADLRNQQTGFSHNQYHVQNQQTGFSQNQYHVQNQQTSFPQNQYHVQNQHTGLSQSQYHVQNQHTGLSQSQYYVQNQHTGLSQSQYYVQNQPGFLNQYPRQELNTVQPVSTALNQSQTEYNNKDPQGTLFSSRVNLDTVGNQMPPAVENQMPSTLGNQMPSHIGNQMPPNLESQMPLALGDQFPSTLGNQMSSTLKTDRLSVSSNSENNSQQNKVSRIHRNVNPCSIRRKWSTSNPKPCNRIQICVVSQSGNK